MGTGRPGHFQSSDWWGYQHANDRFPWRSSHRPSAARRGSISNAGLEALADGPMRSVRPQDHRPNWSQSNGDYRQHFRQQTGRSAPSQIPNLFSCNLACQSVCIRHALLSSISRSTQGPTVALLGWWRSASLPIHLRRRRRSKACHCWCCRSHGRWHPLL